MSSIKDQLVTRLADLQAQLNEVNARIRPLAHEIDLQDEVLASTDSILYGAFPPRYDIETEAKQRRAKAAAARTEASRALQPLRTEADKLRLQIAGVERELSHCAFIDTKLSELKRQSDELVSQLATAEKLLADATTQHVEMLQKMRGFNQLLTNQSEAQDKVDKAREALEDAEADALITGVPVDLSPHKARIGKAEKLLADAVQLARGCGAASLRVNQAAEALQEEIETLERSRAGLMADWWAMCKHQEVVRFRAAATALAASAQTMAALDARTGDSLGSVLLEHLRTGLRLPVKGGTEPLTLPPFDKAQCLDKLTEALNASISSAKQ